MTRKIVNTIKGAHNRFWNKNRFQYQIGIEFESLPEITLVTASNQVNTVVKQMDHRSIQIFYICL